MKRRFVVRLYEEQPETRWFRRHVLRRKYRPYLVHAGIAESFTIERNINNLTNSVIVVRDPMELLTAMEVEE